MVPETRTLLPDTRKKIFYNYRYPKVATRLDPIPEKMLPEHPLSFTRKAAGSRPSSPFGRSLAPGFDRFDRSDRSDRLDRLDCLYRLYRLDLNLEFMVFPLL